MARRRMRTGVLLLLTALWSPQAAQALDRNETMTQWLRASEADRSRVLDEVLARTGKGRQSDRATVMACMNGAASFAGHGELRIDDVAEACSEPVAPSDGV